MKKTILLVDDHKMMRDGLRLFVQQEGDLEVVGEASDGESGVALAQKLNPDLIIMDIDLPDIDGIEVSRRVQAMGRQTKILFLSGYCDQQFVGDALTAGAAGYVLKANAASELLQAIRSIFEGQVYLSPEASRELVNAFQKKRTAGPVTERALSQRETEVLRLLAEGRSTKEIATDLGISPKTVETHRQRIMAKLNLSNVADLTKYALREGLISL